MASAPTSNLPKKPNWLLLACEAAPMCCGARPRVIFPFPLVSKTLGGHGAMKHNPFAAISWCVLSPSMPCSSWCQSRMQRPGNMGGPVLQAGWLYVIPVPKGTTYILCASSNIMAASISACACMKNNYKKTGISCVVLKDAAPQAT